MNRLVPWLVIFGVTCLAAAGILKSENRRQEAIGAKLMSLGAKNTAPWTFRFNKTDFVVNGRKVTLKRDGLNLGFKAVTDPMLELLVAYENRKRTPVPNINVVSYSAGCLFTNGYWIHGRADLDKKANYVTLGKVGYGNIKVAENYMEQLIGWKNKRPAEKVKAEATK